MRDWWCADQLRALEPRCVRGVLWTNGQQGLHGLWQQFCMQANASVSTSPMCEGSTLGATTAETAPNDRKGRRKQHTSYAGAKYVTKILLGMMCAPRMPTHLPHADRILTATPTHTCPSATVAGSSPCAVAGSCALGVMARQRCPLPPPARRRWHAQRRVARHAAAPPSVAARTLPRSRLCPLPRRRFPPSPSRVRTNKPSEWPDGSLTVGNWQWWRAPIQLQHSVPSRSPARSARDVLPSHDCALHAPPSGGCWKTPGRTYYCRLTLFGLRLSLLFLMNTMFLMDIDDAGLNTH